MRYHRTLYADVSEHFLLTLRVLKVQYVPLEQWQFQSSRIEFLTLEGFHVLFEDSVTPTKVVLHFRKYYQL